MKRILFALTVALLSVTMCAATSSGIYLKGTFNNWESEAKYEFLTDGDGNYWLNDVVLAGEFKIADADWKTYNYGSNGSNIVANMPYSLVSGTNVNISCGAATIHCQKIEFSVNYYGEVTLLLIPSAAESPDAYYPILLSDNKILSTSSSMLYDFRCNNSTSHTYVWEETYNATWSPYSSVQLEVSNQGSDKGWAGAGWYFTSSYNDDLNSLLTTLKAAPADWHLRLAVKSFDHASHAIGLFDGAVGFTLGTKSIDYKTVYQDFERDGEWHVIDVPFSYFGDALQSIPAVSTKDGTNLLQIISEAIQGAQISISDICIYKGTLSIPVLSTIFIRLNPYSVDWDNAYLYVWNDYYYYEYAETKLVVSEKMGLAEDGWWTCSFDIEPETSFYVGFNSYYDEYRPNYYDRYNTYSASTCFEVNTYGTLQTTTYMKLIPDESNTFAVHVATAGTFGQVMVQTLGELTWTDIVSLTVTGFLNDEDTQYLSRMTNLQHLDLSGTNITKIDGFKDMARLSQVVLPASCKTINANAFQNCKHLVSINLDNVQTIGNYAFNNDSKLASLYLPMATSIGKYAFANCSALDMVDMAEVTSLGAYAFNQASNLQQVNLSNQLESIPDHCFESCSKLKTISLPASLKEIGNYALPTIVNTTLPEGVTKVGSINFSNATSINIPSTVTSWSSFSSTWKHVYCGIVVPPTFSVFNTDYVSNDTLHVPAISLAAYKLNDNWYKFGNIVAMDGAVNELRINGDFMLLTTNGIADKTNLKLDHEADLTMSAENTLHVGDYSQLISCSQWQRSSDYYYDSNGNYQYYYGIYLSYTGALIANSAMDADNVTVKLVPRANQWNFFSLPYDVNMSDITLQTEGSGTVGTSQWVIREYSGANRASGSGTTWNNVPVDGVLKANTGYILYWTVSNSSNYDNNNSYAQYNFLYYFNMPAVKNANMQNIFATGDVNVPLIEYSAEVPQNRSWNLVGNPYPCAFDISQMEFGAPITVWNGYNYVAYSLEDDIYRLRPAEAFFVQAPQGTKQITFHKEGRQKRWIGISLDEYNSYHAPQRKSFANEARKVFNFFLLNADYSDRARLVLNEQALADYEITRDAAKMMSSDNTVPQLYVNNSGIRYAIDERPEQGSYTLGAFFGKAGEYTLHLNVPQNEERQIILTDTDTQITTDLTIGDYTFTTEAGSYDNRFVITLVSRVATGIDETPSLSEPMKTIENGKLIITNPQGKKYTVGGIKL